MTDVPIRTSLRRAPRPAMSLEALKAMAGRAWRERGVAIIWPDQVHNDFDRQAIINVANEIYGKRAGYD